MRRSLGISEPEAPRLEVTRMGRRHLRGVMGSERQAYPRPWSPNLFLSEMSESRNRCYLVARLDREGVGYGGVVCSRGEGPATKGPRGPRTQRGTRNRYYLVGRLDREVVGDGGLICYGEEAHVTSVAVDPERQREKIGTR